ncbi:hypothetical protein ABLE68_03965 [Nocardioides sp. CN2-186]|uniref:hypothetical protein n=1 Tax=Nocardioides tweenelious TaxID=3156607 RepID=UPI0032B46947
MSDDDLGPMPEPKIEPGEPNPGGADALKEDPESGGAIPDLTPDENPAIDDQVPDEVKGEVEGSEDTSTKATRDEDGSEETDKESPA